MASKLHHKRIAQTAGAIAGLASAVSFLVGLLAAHEAPRGWARVTVALHFSHAPLIVRLAPVIAAIALIVAAGAGVLTFYSWCRGDGGESREVQPTTRGET